MSKTLKVWLAVALVLILTGAMLIAGEFLRGTSWTELWNSSSISIGVVSTGYGDMKDYTVCSTGEESFSPDEVTRLDIGWISGSVRLETGGDRISLKESCAQTLKEDQKLCWKLENGTLSVRYCTASRTQTADKDLVILVPAGWTPKGVTVGATSARLELRDLTVGGPVTVDATSGDVRCSDIRCDALDAGGTSGLLELKGCECGRLTLSTTSGDLYAEGFACDKLDAGATSGSVTLLNGSCDRLEAATTSGKIVVRCEAKEIKLGATSGNIRCEGVPAGCDVDCGTTSGTVKLSLNGSTDGQRIHIDTTSGDVYLDLPGAMDLDFDTASGDLSGRMEQREGGCAQVRVETTSGDLILGGFA